MVYQAKTSVTVCILTYKRPYGLKRLLNALIPQTKSRKRQIVVLNDGSHDELYQKVIDAFSHKITYKALKKNVGIAKARNEVARIAKNDYLIFIDDDCVPPSYWLDWIVAQLDSHPELDLVAGMTKPLIVKKPSFFARVQVAHRFYPSPQKNQDQLTFVTANLAVRRSFFFELGGFTDDSEFPGAGEDTEFAARVSRTSCNRKLDYDWFVYHEVGDGIKNNIRRYWRYGFGNVWMQQFTTSPPFLDSTLKYLSFDGRVFHFYRSFKHRYHEAKHHFSNTLQAVISALIASTIDAAYREGCRSARLRMRQSK